ARGGARARRDLLPDVPAGRARELDRRLAEAGRGAVDRAVHAGSAAGRRAGEGASEEGGNEEAAEAADDGLTARVLGRTGGAPCAVGTASGGRARVLGRTGAHSPSGAWGARTGSPVARIC